MIFIFLLLIFVIGIIFVSFILPIIDGIVGVILQQFEVWKSAMALELTQNSVKTHELQQQIENPQKGQQTQVIGFVLDEEEELEENDEDI